MTHQGFSEPSLKKAAVIGTGPAGLMAAETISSAGVEVHLFDKRKSAGRKLLIAGSSGLNVSTSCPLEEMIAHLKGAPPDRWRSLFRSFSVEDWLRFIHDLGFRTFEGSGRKHLLEDRKAAGFLKKWVERLRSRGVAFHLGLEITGFSKSDEGLFTLDEAPGEAFDAICFALGGGSCEPTEKPLRWPRFFQRKKVRFRPFAPSNAGHQVPWKMEFLKEAEGKPLKNIVLSSEKGSKHGEIVITRYGLEGSPVYSAASVGENFLDLKPDWSEEQILSKCLSLKENLSPIRKAKKKLRLPEAALSLLFHHSPPGALDSLEALARTVKKFPIRAVGAQPLEESISAAGGIDLGELDERYMLKKWPGAFAVGEMLDWDAPTGGFLIQTCVSQGYVAGRAIADRLKIFRGFPVRSRCGKLTSPK